jgi:serine/threonine protein kinase
VRFYGLEEEDLQAFILMDYIEGPTRREEIRRAGSKGIPLKRIQAILEDICAALHYAHKKGLVHCDIKSGNVLLDKSGKAYLTDFGISRGMEAATSTMVGIGTPAYMAPELIKGKDPTPQTDIYALGIVLYEMLTGGERPFTGERATITGTTAEKVRWEHLKLKPSPVSNYNVGAAPEMDAIISVCLAKESKNRYQSMLVFMEKFYSIDDGVKAEPKELDDIKNIEKFESLNPQHDHIEKKKESNDRNQLEKETITFKKKKYFGIGILVLIIGVFSTLIFLNQDKLKSNIFDSQANSATSIPTLTTSPTITPTLTPLPIGTEILNRENIDGVEKLSELKFSGVNKFTNSTFLEFSDEVVSLGSDDVIYFWDYRNGEINAEIETGLDGIWDIDISEESDQIAIVTTNGNLRIWQISSKELISDSYFPQGAVLSVGLNPDGKTAIVGTWRPNGIYSLDLEKTDAEFELVTTSKNEIGAIQFSDDGNIYVAGTDYNLLKVFDANSNENIRILRGHKGWIRDLEFSPDGRYLASASADNTVKVWDIESGKLLKSLEGHEFWAMRVDYSPNGELLLSSSEDGKVRVWDSITGELLSTIWSHVELEPGYLYSTDAIFSPDDKFLVVDISSDSVVEIWGLKN